MSELKTIEPLILTLRGQKVILDSDLAEAYGVQARRLNEQVKRNIDRFPEDFMFQLTETEWSNLMSQFATTSHGGRRKLPFVFTEYGAIMAASVLNSPKAVEMSKVERASRSFFAFGGSAGGRKQAGTLALH